MRFVELAHRRASVSLVCSRSAALSLKSTTVWKGKVNELRTTRRICRGVPSVDSERARRDGEDWKDWRWRKVDFARASESGNQNRKFAGSAGGHWVVKLRGGSISAVTASMKETQVHSPTGARLGTRAECG